jgi:predicted signal transduction protein with EAL and GGDEF domain
MTFRLGGDEFVILIEDTYSKTVIENYLKHIHEALMLPIVVEEKTFYITCSDGIVVYPDDGMNFHDLFKNADTALYEAKGMGKGITSFNNAKMGEDASEKARIQTDLHTAVENEELKLYYQPIVSVDTGRIKGCEALIRWIHPEHGLIPPDKFINIAEENGTIIEIGKWIFRNACKYAKWMNDRGYTDFYVSINVSPNQLLQNEFIDFILDTILLDFVYALVSLALCLILVIFCDTGITKETYTTKTELVALNDYTGYKDKLSGYYFLFFGQVDGEKSDTYNIRYAYKDDNEVIRIQSKDLSKDNIGFVEDNTKIMEITHTKEVDHYNSLGKFLFKGDEIVYSDQETDYIFHIPKDSIIKDINIDLK